MRLTNNVSERKNNNLVFYFGIFNYYLVLYCIFGNFKYLQCSKCVKLGYFYNVPFKKIF